MWRKVDVFVILCVCKVGALTVDSQFGTSSEDCFERLLIGWQLPQRAIFRNATELTTRECEKLCRRDKKCRSYDYGVGAKGNATCNLSDLSEKDITENKIAQKNTDYDIHIRRFRCEQPPPKPLQPNFDDLIDDPEEKPALNPQNDEDQGHSERPPKPQDQKPSPNVNAYHFRPPHNYDLINHRPNYNNNHKPNYHNDNDRPDAPYPDINEPDSNIGYGQHKPTEIPFRPNYHNHSKPKPDPYDVLHFQHHYRPSTIHYSENLRPDPPYHVGFEVDNSYGLKPTPGHYRPEKPIYPDQNYYHKPILPPITHLPEYYPNSAGLKPGNKPNWDGYGSGYNQRPEVPSYGSDVRPIRPSYGGNSPNHGGGSHYIYLEINETPKPFKKPGYSHASDNYYAKPDSDYHNYQTSNTHKPFQSYYGQSNYGDTSYDKPSYDKPGYDKPGYDRPSYENHNTPSYSDFSYNKPSYVKPSYTKPSYGESSSSGPSYSEPSYNKPSYEESSYNTPIYGGSSDHGYSGPSNQKPGYSEPSYNKPSYEKPSYNEPSYEKPSYNKPSYEESSDNDYTAPSYEKPSHNEPVYNKPTYENPSYTKPSYEKPSYNKPSYGESSDHGYSGPSYQSSGYSESSYNKPSNEKPSYNKPVYGGSSDHGYSGPSNQKPGYSKPSYNKPSYEKPIYNTPSYEKPSYSKPSYGESSDNDYTAPSYGKPGHNEQSYNKPSYEKPSYTKPSYGDSSDTGYSAASFEKPDYSEPSYNKPSYNYERPSHYSPFQSYDGYFDSNDQETFNNYGFDKDKWHYLQKPTNSHYKPSTSGNYGNGYDHDLEDYKDYDKNNYQSSYNNHTGYGDKPGYPKPDITIKPVYETDPYRPANGPSYSFKPSGHVISSSAISVVNQGGYGNKPGTVLRPATSRDVFEGKSYHGGRQCYCWSYIHKPKDGATNRKRA